MTRNAIQVITNKPIKYCELPPTASIKEHHKIPRTVLVF